MEVKKIRRSIIRVNHAGEYAATYIYKGQIAGFKGDQNLQTMIKDMLQTEQEHLEFFTQKMQKEKIRPTILLPLWKVLGFGLGLGTALLGEKVAMACTASVEDVIEKHYSQQLSVLQKIESDDDLKENIARIRQEEMEHMDTGTEHSRQLPFHSCISGIIKLGCKYAIFLSKRI